MAVIQRGGADDDELVTWEWFREVAQSEYLEITFYGKASIAIPLRDIMTLEHIKTRGDVRLLLKALGV